MRTVRSSIASLHRWKTVRPSRRVFAAVIALAMAVLATGCQGSPSSTAARTGAVTVAAIPGPDNAPLYLAVKNGTFTRAGLNVKIRTYRSTSSELQALNAGRVDVAAGDYADFLYAQATAAKPDLRIIADGYHAAPGVMEVLSRSDSGISTAQDLAGKTIGTPPAELIPVSKTVPYSLATLATQSVLQSDGVKLGKVKWKPMPSGDLISALAHHQVDAILVQEPYILAAQTQIGTVEVLDSASGATAGLPLSGYFAVTHYASQHADMMRGFRSALQQAQAQAVMPGPIKNILASAQGMSPQSASLITMGSYPTSLDAPALQRVANLMFNFGVLNKHALYVAPMFFP